MRCCYSGCRNCLLQAEPQPQLRVQACAPTPSFTFSALLRLTKDATIKLPQRHMDSHRMQPSICCPGLAVVLFMLCARALAQTQAQAPTAPATVVAPTAPAAPNANNPPSAGEGCDAAVIEAIKRVRGKDVQEVQLIGGKRVLSQVGDDETSVRGEGRYRGNGRVTPFSYGCSVNNKSGSATGVVFRETGPDTTREQPAWQPDLTHVSPVACESATAALLKNKHPRVARISLDAETRQLRRGPDDRIVLEGHGAVQRAPGMNSVPFTYRCEIEPRDGRIVNVETGV